MKKIEDYIYVENHIPKELCEKLIDECNTKEWKPHTWNNYAEGTFESEPTKELFVMSCTQEQQNKITPHLVKALEAYQNKYSTPGEKTSTVVLPHQVTQPTHVSTLRVHNVVPQPVVATKPPPLEIESKSQPLNLGALTSNRRNRIEINRTQPCGGGA